MKSLQGTFKCLLRLHDMYRSIQLLLRGMWRAIPVARKGDKARSFKLKSFQLNHDFNRQLVLAETLFTAHSSARESYDIFAGLQDVRISYRTSYCHTRDVFGTLLSPQALSLIQALQLSRHNSLLRDRTRYCRLYDHITSSEDKKGEERSTSNEQKIKNLSQPRDMYVDLKND
jgi:hypothetical protein